MAASAACRSASGSGVAVADGTPKDARSRWPDAGLHAGDAGADAIDDVRRLVHAGVVEDQGELVAAEAEGAVRAAQRRAQHLADRLERLVAGEVPVGVVEGLEAVDVEDHEREALAVARGAMDLLGQPPGEGAAVAHAGQRVVSARNCISSKAATTATAVAAWLANMRSACRLFVDGIRRSSGSSAQMTPDELAGAVVQRDQQPVVVPGQRAAAVARRLVGRALDAQARARLVAGEQEAALDSNSGSSRRRRVARSPLCEASTSSVVQPDDRARHGALRGGVDELDGDVVEAQRGADALADPLRGSRRSTASG